MRKFVLALIPLALLACDRQPAAPAIDEAPSLNWMNNPDVGNFKVFRGEYDLWACWTDPTTGLRACHSTFPLNGGACALNGTDPADWQEVVVDDDVLRVIANATGDMFITVRDLNTAGDCFGADLVAEGWGTMRYTDNDEFGQAVESANAWGFVASGNLTTAGGEPVDYNGILRLRYNNSVGLKILARSVNLQ